MGRLYCIGEMLIDFIPIQTGLKLKEVESFKRVAGGAPLDVAINCSKLGLPSIMLSKVAEDPFGEFLIDHLNENGVDTSYIVRTSDAETGLAFVSVTKEGERDFSFYRKNAADLMLKSDEITELSIDENDILHFGSVVLQNPLMKETHHRIINEMIDKGGIISFDPNIRLSLWPSAEACRDSVWEFLEYADILKVSEEELFFITGEDVIERGIEKLFERPIEAVICTLGKDGSELYLKNNNSFKVDGYKVDVVDTTGAGDAFMGGFLYSLSKLFPTRSNLVQLLQKNAIDLLSYANATGAIITSREGAYDPSLSDSKVKKVLEQQN